MIFTSTFSVLAPRSQNLRNSFAPISA